MAIGVIGTGADDEPTDIEGAVVGTEAAGIEGADVERAEVAGTGGTDV
jgi:hypothetical protein